jgi:hypothetical protein
MVVGLFAFVPMAARGADTIAFLDTRDLVVRITPSQHTATSILTLVNSGSAPRTVSLQVVGVHDAMGHDVSSTSLASLSPVNAKIQPGKTTQFTLTWKRPEPAGTYVGELVAVTDDGSVARLGLTLAIDEATVPSAGAVTPPLTDSVTITGTNFGFASVVWSPHLNSVLLPSPAPPKEQVVGLVSGDGSIGQLVEDTSRRITVRGISRSGTYSGNLDLRPGAAGGEAKATVRLRDWIVSPLIVLAVALGFSYWIDRWARVGRPRQRLKIALSGLKDQAVQKQDAELRSKQTHEGDWPFKDDVYRVYVPPSGPTAAHGVLETAAKDALKSFKDADSDAERGKWGPGGDELKRVSEYVTKLDGIYATSQVIAEAWVSLRALHDAHPYPADKPLEQWTVMQKAEDALKPRTLEDDGDFTELQGQLKTAASFIIPFVGVYGHLEALLAEDPDTASRVEALRVQLIDAATAEDVNQDRGQGRQDRSQSQTRLCSHGHARTSFQLGAGSHAGHLVSNARRGHAGRRAGSLPQCPSARPTEATRDHR